MNTVKEKKQTTKKMVVSPEVVASESSRLVLLWDRAKRRPAALTQKEFGQKYEVGGQAFVRQMIAGERPINLTNAMKFASYFGCKVGEFSPRIQDEIDRIAVFATSSSPEVIELVTILTPDLRDMIKRFSMLDDTKKARIQAQINDEYDQILRTLQRLSGDRATNRVKRLTESANQGDFEPEQPAV